MPVDTGIYSHDGLPVLQLLRDLVEAANNSLLQTQLGTPSEYGLWHDQPVEDCCDRLVLWVREWSPIVLTEFPNAATGTQACDILDLPPKVSLSLRRPCAPVPNRQGNVPLSDENAVAEHLILDARALICGVQSTWPALLDANYPMARIAYGPIVPAGSTTNCMGLDWDITLEIPGCRANCS